MAKRKVKEVWQPPTIEQMIESWRKDWQGRPQMPAPTRFFKIGEEVRWGGHKNTHVVSEIDGGMGYLVHYDYESPNSQVKHNVGDACVDWFSMFPIDNDETGFAQKDDLRIIFTNSNIECLIHKVLRFGVDFEPPYQRGLVWSMDQKTALLDSVFQNIDIGKFTFSELPLKAVGNLYEIIDGKQRLTTICEFFEGRLAYRGKLYHELSWRDRNHFENYPIVQAEMRDATEQQILKLFVKLNTTGVPMDADHLAKVKSLITESK